tara:strand:- start:7564 stop:8025 length:462 start_codon:yes stop_codon:yes gene_type:complete
MNKKRQKADRWFAAHGINPNTPDRTNNSNVLDLVPERQWPKAGEDAISYSCTISVQGYLFYSHVSCIFEDSEGNTYEYEGGAGGIGIGDIEAEGIIYFGNEETLLKATTFGEAFIAEDGGTLQLTWGTSGNATAVGIGEGLGAFGGSGSWKKL